MYKLVVNGIVVKEASKIQYLRLDFYHYIRQKQNVCILRNNKKVWLNGKENKYGK